MAVHVLALDIGGTKLATAAVHETGDVLAERMQATSASAAPSGILDTLFAMAEETLAEAGLSRDDLSGVGVSFGGPVDFAGGKAVTCHHLPGWENYALRDVIADRTGLPTIVDNDANAAALGEVMFGAARGRRHVLYLTVSTGVGGALVLDGRVHRGAGSMAGEIGHTVVVPDGPVCTCGQRGCLEAVASGPAIARAAREEIAAGKSTVLAAVPACDLTAKHVAEAAPRDAVAARVLADAGRHLGMAIAAAVNLINPELVVIGGGVSQAGEALFGPIRTTVSRLAAAESVRDLRIVPGTLGQRGGLLGAAALALSRRAAG